MSPAPVTGGKVGWSAQGGTPIFVGTGDSLASISNRYGVPAAAILSANGLSNPAQVKPGSQIVIPVYNAAGQQTVATAPSAAPAQPQMRFTQGVQPAVAKPAKAEPVATMPAPVKSPGKTAVAAAPGEAPKPAAAPGKPPAQQAQPQPAKQPIAEKAPAAKDQKVAALSPAEPQQTASIAKEEPAAAAPSAASGPEFRWPARGRVISGFSKGGNEGINIAVPEGTPVKAAEGGTVAYAGNELKGYGNLVLIRHDDGWVSAYAHNGEITVKRGEKVKRGQVIARSGQTGNVSSPQLHFELRRGSTPVDPVPHLAGM
ncbi:M23 family metallopeptidase [Chelatococcus sp. SYSU_G07232]|uniref:M23 family metallopeptidase n=1 Tax=Chelatococcus albus TaxID=3047466 RepID=A0ABT7ACM9_9HYPH|nr:M23 family metallopeptidase [Chelatococcus sp. SYSU_G07232]MDJ1157127.1 M23 family metallopeptidase [Chelatococcus sp. SYSU_G07232]